MALNKKLIVLSGVGLVFAGVGAGVIGYKASQVADGQKQMDDSKASMGGQLSFGLASPMATMAATAADDFMANIGSQIQADAALGHINYVNLSDSIQGDLITGIAHTANMLKPGTPATTNVGDPQFALDTILQGQIAASAPAAKSLYKAIDFEIPNLKASDIRRMINNDLSDERIFQLFSSSPVNKMTLAAAVASKDASAISALKSKILEDAKSEIKNIVKEISTATVVSLNVGIEDIIEAASNGVDFTTLVMNQFDPAASKDAPNLMTLMAGLQNGGSDVMKSAINAVGNLNGALSAIRRLNPTAKIALGQLGTYGIDAIDAQLSQINSALMVAAFTQDIKSGDVMVAPVDPKAKSFAGKSLQDIYADPSTSPEHKAVADRFQIMMFQANPDGKAALEAAMKAAGNSSPTDAELLAAIGQIMLKQATDAIGKFEAAVTDPAAQAKVYDGATTPIEKAKKIAAYMDAQKATV